MRILVLVIAAFAGTLGQIGLVFTPKKIAFNLSNINPISGFSRLFSSTSLIEAGKGVAKMRDQIVPSTLNLDEPSESCKGVDLVPHVAKERKVRAVLNNSFGFGGTNASLIFRRHAA